MQISSTSRTFEPFVMGHVSSRSAQPFQREGGAPVAERSTRVEDEPEFKEEHAGRTQTPEPAQRSKLKLRRHSSNWQLWLIGLVSFVFLGVIAWGVALMVGGERPAGADSRSGAGFDSTRFNREIQAASDYQRDFEDLDRTELLEQADELIAKLEQVNSTQDFKKLCFPAEDLNDRFERYYRTHRLDTGRIRGLREDSVEWFDRGLAVLVDMSDFLTRTLFLVWSDGEWLVDWEAWTAYCEVDPRGIGQMPVGHEFNLRVRVSGSDYYNHGFADQDQWSAYRVEFPGYPGASHYFAYAKRGSDLDRRLRVVVMGAGDDSPLIRVSAHPDTADYRQLNLVKIISPNWSSELKVSSQDE